MCSIYSNGFIILVQNLLSLLVVFTFKRSFSFLNCFYFITVLHPLKSPVLAFNSWMYSIICLSITDHSIFNHFFDTLSLIFYQSVSHKKLYHRTFKLSFNQLLLPGDTGRCFNVCKTSIRRRWRLDVLSTLKRRRVSIG